MTTANFDQLLAFCLHQIQTPHPPQVAAAMTLAQLGLDSLQLIELQMEIEDTFDLTFDVDALRADLTLAALVASVQRDLD